MLESRPEDCLDGLRSRRGFRLLMGFNKLLRKRSGWQVLLEPLDVRKVGHQHSSLEQDHLQAPLPLVPIGHHPGQQPVESAVVIPVREVAEFVGHYVLDARPRGANQVDVQRHRP